MTRVAELLKELLLASRVDRLPSARRRDRDLPPEARRAKGGAALGGEDRGKNAAGEDGPRQQQKDASRHSQ
jgi:hypothetical protein